MADVVATDDTTRPIGVTEQLAVVNSVDADHAPLTVLEQFDWTCTSYKVLESNPVSVFDVFEVVIVIQALDETGL